MPTLLFNFDHAQDIKEEEERPGKCQTVVRSLRPLLLGSAHGTPGYTCIHGLGNGLLVLSPVNDPLTCATYRYFRPKEMVEAAQKYNVTISVMRAPADLRLKMPAFHHLFTKNKKLHTNSNVMRCLQINHGIKTISDGAGVAKAWQASEDRFLTTSKLRYLEYWYD